MIDKYICLDIETIPNPTLPEWVMEYATKKVEKKHKENRDVDKYLAVLPETGRIVCIVISISGEDFFTFKGEEQNILQQFWDAMKDNIGYRLVGFNSKSFDIPYINKRSCILNVNNYGIDFPIRKWEKNFHYDVLEVLSNFDSYNGHSLETYCKFYNIPYENGIDGSEIYNIYKFGNLNDIYEKCLNDVKSTCKLYEKVVSYL